MVAASSAVTGFDAAVGAQVGGDGLDRDIGVRISELPEAVLTAADDDQVHASTPQRCSTLPGRTMVFSRDSAALDALPGSEGGPTSRSDRHRAPASRAVQTLG